MAKRSLFLQVVTVLGETWYLRYPPSNTCTRKIVMESGLQNPHVEVGWRELQRGSDRVANIQGV